VTRRDVSPLEQHVHSFLELVPLAAVMLLTLLYWPQVKALCGLEIAPPSTIRLKREPLAPGYIVSALAAMAVFAYCPTAKSYAAICGRAETISAPAASFADPFDAGSRSRSCRAFFGYRFGVRCPDHLGLPYAGSFFVRCSNAAFSLPPTRITMTDSQNHIMKPITAPSEP
jgi:hypothetical protein